MAVVTHGGISIAVTVMPGSSHSKSLTSACGISLLSGYKSNRFSCLELSSDSYWESYS